MNKFGPFNLVLHCWQHVHLNLDVCSNVLTKGHHDRGSILPLGYLGKDTLSSRDTRMEDLAVSFYRLL